MCPNYNDHSAFSKYRFILQGFPHPLHSAELILQLVRRVSSRPTGGDDREEATNSVMSSHANESPTDVDSSKVSYHVIDEKSRSLLATVAKNVRQWALLHAYSSSWIKHFQCST